jgi:hypothetical protein
MHGHTLHVGTVALAEQASIRLDAAHIHAGFDALEASL